MPQNIDVEGVGIIEFPDETKPDEIQKVLSEKFGQKVSAGGAFARGAAESVLPSMGAAVAAGIATSELNPLAHVAPPWSEIGFGLGGAVLGGWGLGKLQDAAAKAAIPEQYQQFQNLRKQDVEQQFLPSAAGELAGALTSFEVAPGQTISGVGKILKGVSGKALSKVEQEMAIGTGVQLGFGAAQTALSGDTSLKGMTKEMVIMSMLGHSRWKGIRPSTATFEKAAAVSPPEVKAQSEQHLVESAAQSGKKWRFVDGDLEDGNPTDVAHTDPATGDVLVSRKNFHEWLDRDVPKGYDRNKAIDNLVNHETIHGVTPDGLAKEFEESLTKFQKWNYRRRYHGPSYQGKELSGITLGKEALRYEIQLASEMEPSEYIAHAQEAKATKFLTVMDKAANFFRSKARTDAQRAMVDKLQANVEAAKGASDASGQQEDVAQSETSATLPSWQESSQEQAAKTAGQPSQKITPTTNAGATGGGQGVESAQPSSKGKESQEGLGTSTSEPSFSGLQQRIDQSTRELRSILQSDGSKAGLSPEYVRQLESSLTGKPNQANQGLGVQVLTELIQKGVTPERIAKSFAGLTTEQRGVTPTQLWHSLRERLLAEKGQSKEAPPTAPTGEAQPAQEQTGLATTPPEALTSGGPAATSPISGSFPAVKMQELEALTKKVQSKDFDWDKKTYDRYVQLSEELDRAEAASGPQETSGPPMAMSRKPLSDDWKKKFETLPPKAKRSSIPVVLSGADGSEIPAYFEGWGDGINAAGTGLEKVPWFSRLVEGGQWSTGLLHKGEQISEGEITTPPAEALAMSRKLNDDHESLNKKYPSVGFLNPETSGAKGNYWISPDGKMGRVDNHPRAAERITKKLVEEMAEDGEDPYEGMFKDGWIRGAWDAKNNTLWLENYDRPISPSVKRELKNWGIENKASVSIDNRHRTKEQPPIYEASADSMAMARKPRSPEEELAANLVRAVGGIRDDKAKLDMVQAHYDRIVALPREQWGPELTKFHQEWKGKEIQDAVKDKVQGIPIEALQALADQAGVPVDELKASLERGEAAIKGTSPETIKASLGAADRSVIYRGALATLNLKVEPIHPGGAPFKPQPLGFTPSKTVVEPADIRYEVGNYKRFQTDMQKLFPEIPEEALKDIWNEAKHDFLINASGDKIKELLRPARLEKQFLGEGLLRVMPDASPHPLLEDMAKYKQPLDSPAFKRFCAVRDLTPEEGKALIEQLRDMEMVEIHAAREGNVGPKPGEGIARDPLTEGQKKEAERLWREGFRLNQKRRRSAIRELDKWFAAPESAAPEKSPARKTIGLDDIWTEVKGEGVHPYAEYNPKDGEDASFLKSVLGVGGSTGGKTPTTTRSIAVVVDRKTGDHHAVSTYVNHGEVRIYNPDVYAGSKAGNYVSINQLLANYRVAAHLLVRDPVKNFHQEWPSQKAYMDDIGTVAKKLSGEGSSEQYMKYIKEAEEERVEERRRRHKERFFGEVKEEEVVAGEPEEDKTEEQERKEEAARTKAEEKESAEAESTEDDKAKEPLDIKEEMTKSASDRVAEAHSDADDPPLPSKKPGVWDRRSIEVFLKGPGYDELGINRAELSRIGEQSLGANEAESLYGLLNEFNIKSGYDFEMLLRKFEDGLGITREEERRIGLADVVKAKRKTMKPSAGLDPSDITAMYGLDKIVNSIQDRMLRSPVEQRRLEGLKKLAMEGKKPGENPLPDAVYQDMNEAERAYFDALDAVRYRALIRTFDELYALSNEARAHPAPVKKTSPGEFAVSPDTEAFRTGALSKYGDSSRRSVEQAARQAQRSAREKSISGERSLLAGSKFGGTPRTVIDRRLATGQQTLPRPAGQGPEMLPGGYPRQEPQQPPRGAFPLPGVPVTPGDIGGPKFTGQKTAKIPERGTPVGFGQEKGFVPRGNPISDKEMAQMYQRMEAKRKGEPLPMTRKGYGVAERYQEEMRAQGRLTYQKQKQEVVTKEAQIAQGREDVLSGKINPVREMIQFERTGFMREASTPVFRFWGMRLQEAADMIAEKSGGTKSKAYQEAEARSSDWQRRLNAASKQMFAKTGHALQGWNQIGPDDMRSTTFVRNAAKAAKARRLGVKEEDVDLDEGEDAEVAAIVGRAKAAEKARAGSVDKVGSAAATASDTPLDPGQASEVGRVKAAIKERNSKSAAGLKGDSPTEMSAMAMKGEGSGELPKLNPKTEYELADIGAGVMMDLSDSNELTDARWKEEMKKALNSEAINRPDLEPYLDHIRASSEKFVQEAVNNYIGTGSQVEDARKMLTRKKPTIEVSKAAIQRAMEIDPRGNKVTPAEAYHIWNYLTRRFFRPDDGSPAVLDFSVIRTKAAAELGIKDATGKITNPYTQLRLFRAMSSNRSMREMTKEMIKNTRDEARVKVDAINWLKNQQYPGWLRAARMFPRLFFLDKIIGHGLVPMVTHASDMLFNPRAWSVYFGHSSMIGGKKVWVPGAWQEMYHMQFGTNWLHRMAGGQEFTTGRDYHDFAMQDMVGHERFEDWKSAGLQADPFKHTDDYQMDVLKRTFGDKLGPWIEGRGFDALKTLRYAMAEKWLKSLPEHLQNKESMELISDSVNHATGVVKSQFHESLNWAMFAPKLEASRWAYMFKDTAKAANYIAHWKTASLEQRAWAKSEMQQKAMVVAGYAGMLALNQAILSMAGSDQKINMTDPKKGDFMSFKMAGFKVGVANPFIGMIRLFANTLHAAAQERTKFEKMTTRQRQLFEVAGSYARGKASPLSSFAIDLATQHDYAGRPFSTPWRSADQPSRSERLRGVSEYGGGEYALTTFTPIPIEEAVKQAFMDGGMSLTDANRWYRILVIAGGMSATGARISQDQ